MDNLIQKFYSNGKEEEQKYTQFGAFSNALLKNSNSNLNFKTTGFLKPNIGIINPSMHNIQTTNQQPKTPNKTPPITQEAFLRPKKLIFNGTTDLFNKSLLNNKFPENNNNIGNNNIVNTQNTIPSLTTMKQNLNLESKKNATKMQMMEEKMKNLGLKSQRLEVINDFFFDMFENNLVKEELKRQKDIKENKPKNENKEDNEDESEHEERPKKKRHKKLKKKKINIDIDDIQAKNQEELDIKNFKKKTQSAAKNYLNTIKNDIGMFLVEEQLKKNETLHNMTEDILELKGDLLNKLEKMQMAQNLEMKKIAYCLQNSGDEKIENLANRIFGDNILKNVENVNSFNNTRVSGSVFNPRDSLFNTNKFTKMPSLSTIGDDKFKTNRLTTLEREKSDEINNRTRRKSLFDKEKNNEGYNGSKRPSILERERKLTLLDKEKNVIPEEKNENENDNDNQE